MSAQNCNKNKQCMTSNAHAEERQCKKLIQSSTWYNCHYCISSVSQYTAKRHTISKCLVCSQDTAKSYKFSVSYDTSLDVFLFFSNTCTKFCCKNLVTDFSQQMIIYLVIGSFIKIPILTVEAWLYLVILTVEAWLTVDAWLYLVTEYTWL